MALPGQVAVVGYAHGSSCWVGLVGDLNRGKGIEEVSVLIEQVQGDLHAVVAQRAPDGALERDVRAMQGGWDNRVRVVAGVEHVHGESVIRQGSTWLPSQER